MKLRYFACALLCSTLFTPLCIAGPTPPSVQNILLDRQVLTATLLAEIALQRNLYGDAYMAYLSGAKVGKRPELADRAFQLAKAAKDQKKIKEAFSLLESLDADNPYVLIEKNQSLLASGKYNELPNAFIKKIQSAEPPAEWLRELTFLTTKNQDKKARYNFLKSIASVPPFSTDAKSRMLLAYAANEAGNTNEALEQALAATQLAPDDGQLLLESADFQFPIDPDNTKTRLSAFLEKHPDNFYVYLGLARVYARTKHSSESLSAIEAAVKLAQTQATDVAQTLFFAGNIAEENKAYLKAKNYYIDYLQAIEGNNNYLPDAAYARLGVISLETKNLDRALHYFLQVEKGDNYLGSRIKAAEILSMKGNVDEACKILKTTKTADKQRQASLYEGCADILFRHHKLNQARQVLKEATELDSNNTAYLFHAASYALREKEFDLAETLFKQYIKQKPEDPHGYNSLGYMWLDVGIKTKEARPLIEKAYKLSRGKDPSIVDSLGWLYFREGRLIDAERTIRIALASSNEAEIRLHLGEILMAQKRYSEAKEILKALLSDETVSQRATQLLSRIDNE